MGYPERGSPDSSQFPEYFSCRKNIFFCQGKQIRAPQAFRVGWVSSVLHTEVGTGLRAPLLAAGSEPSTQLYFIFGSSRFSCCPSFFLVHLSSLSLSPALLAEAGLCSCPGTEQRGAGGRRLGQRGAEALGGASRDGREPGAAPSHSSRKARAEQLDLCSSASPTVKLGKGLQLSSAE